MAVNVEGTRKFLFELNDQEMTVRELRYLLTKMEFQGDMEGRELAAAVQA